VEMLLQVGLSNALVASVLAAGVACVSRYVRRPALVHSLWLLVLLKLITPPLWSVPVLSPETPAHAASVFASAFASTAAPEPPASAEPEFAAETFVDLSALAEWEFVPVLRELPVDEVQQVVLRPTDAFDSMTMGDVPNSAALTPSSVFALITAWPMPPWSVLVLGAWAAGSLFWIGLAGWRIARFGWLVRQAHPAPLEVLDRVDELCGRLGIATAPRVGLVRGCVSPLLWALSGAPRLLLPVALWDQLDDDQRDALLVHELAHLRRRDHWIRNLELVVTALYWWHPVVWWARRSLREAEEQCCDAWVVWAFPKSARAYATALLQTVDFLSGARSGLPAAASGLGHLSCLKRRLIMIMQEPMPRALSLAGRLSVLGLAAVLLPVAPSWAQRPAPEADQVQQQAGRVESDDDNDDDDGEQSKQREEQIAQARVQVRRMETQLNEQRVNVEAKLQKAQVQLQTQMQEAQRALADAQEKLQQAVQRVAELEQGKKGQNFKVESNVKVFTGDPKQFKFQFNKPGGFGPDNMPGQMTRVPGEPGDPNVFVFKRQEVHTGPGGASISGSAGASGSSSGSGGGQGGGAGGFTVHSRAGEGEGQAKGTFKMIAPPGGRAGAVGFAFPGGEQKAMTFTRGAMSNPTEQRIAELEKKLDRLLEEVAKMKKSKSGDDDGADKPARR
jgi:beta-lactamase regulating signal transducer with metallopeptidase domain